MIAGTLILDDITIQFSGNNKDNRTVGMISRIQADGDIRYINWNMETEVFEKALGLALTTNSDSSISADDRWTALEVLCNDFNKLPQPLLAAYYSQLLHKD